MENNTKLTKKMYSTFLRRHSKISFIIIRICYGILLACGLVSLILDLVQNTHTELGSIIYCFLMALIFILYDIFFVKINLALVKDKMVLDCDYKFTILEKCLDLTVEKNGNLVAKSTLSYDMIYKVVFYDDAIYVYINRVNGYILDKNGFNSTEDYQKALQTLLPYADNNKKKNKKG